MNEIFRLQSKVWTSESFVGKKITVVPPFNVVFCVVELYDGDFRRE